MHRSRLFLPLVPAVLALAACGGEATGDTAATSTPPASTAAGSTTDGSSPSTTSPSATASPAAADVQIDDQTGAGDTATVARVTAPTAGFVVVLLQEDDDDRPVAERLLGSAPVPAGSSTDVVVPLDPALPGRRTSRRPCTPTPTGTAPSTPPPTSPSPNPTTMTRTTKWTTTPSTGWAEPSGTDRR
jgi:hypothetical protein